MRRVMASAAVVLMVVGGWLLVRGDVPCELLAAQPACQVAVLPGPTEDTLSLISVGDAPAYLSTGQLRLTTIAVQDDLDVRSWFRARTSGVVDAVPREVIFPPGSDRAQVAEDNAALMVDSQLMATIAALTQIGYELTGEGALVAAVTDDAVTSDLRVGDVIVAIDGQPVLDSRDVVDAVRASEPGVELVLTVEVDGDSRDVDVTLGATPDDPAVAYIGIILSTELDLPVDVQIDAGRIGGPSAGLLFALSIVELLEPEDLTGGLVIAGTGTMDRDGVVGAVGGVRQKVVGATAPDEAEDRATVFLVPRGNLEEARRASVDAEVLLIPVDTLTDAIGALAALRDGRPPRDAVTLAAGR